ncbi:MAG TPA: SIR2 family protein [Acidobacteriota bacterium]|nr:SIR2 family protein [Acidobacteriota bacterium]HNT16445.1 SIR2 family protein [Acidobacteriota bacterium]
MTEPDNLSALREKPFADAVAKFEELLAQSGRAFLMGAGCSKCAGVPLTMELTQETLKSDALDTTTKTILKAIEKLFDGATDANIEDYLSELIDLLAIADRRTTRGAKKKDVSIDGASYSEVQLRAASDQIKRGIAKIFDKKVNIETHQSFIRALHRPLRPGKPTSGQTVDYLVLNYDTLLEDALALERVSFADGIDGGVTGWWRPETFDRDGLAARVFKLHGSINWCELPDDPLPRRIGDSLQITVATERRILIWPASTKYRETQLDPYAQLAERARRVLRPSSGSQCVLVVCGYRFGDAHINLELDRALRESKGDLTMVVFTSDNEPSGQLEKWHKDATVANQLMIFANRGFFHGTQSAAATTDLLWWKFENITRLLGGER